VLDRLTDRTVAVEHGEVTEHLDWERYREAPARDARTRSPPPTPVDLGVRVGQPGAAGRPEAGPPARAAARQAHRTGRAPRRHGRGRHRRRPAAELQAELRDVERELAEVEDRWLELAVDA
jgi:hypothetical protein